MAKKRGNNEGTIVKRADGRWTASITIGRDPQTGKTKRAWFYGKTRQEAAEKLAKALRDYQHGAFCGPEQADTRGMAGYLAVGVQTAQVCY